MNRKLKKVSVTLQSEFPWLKQVKERVCLHSLRWLRIPHENDFKILKLIPSWMQGCYVDAGANLGQSIESILLFRPDAQIISFEPNPELACMLQSRYKGRSNVRIISEGLADCIGQFTLFVPSYKGVVCDGLASLDRVSAATWMNEERVFRFSPSYLNIAEIKCVTTTLDLQQLTPVFIKVDVQGYEYRVLNGARETLRRCEPILVIEDFRGDARTVRLAEELGYEEYRLEGGSLRPGHSLGDNSVLISPTRMKQLRLARSG